MLSVKMSNVDARGVRRGGCSACACTVYDGGDVGKKCVQCGHPPGKHKNTANPVTSRPVAAETQGFTSGSSSSLSGSQFMGQGNTSGSGGYGVYYGQQQTHFSHVPVRPTCRADGCTRLVHFEMGIHPNFGCFDYCSPECRDRHMLPILHAQLEKDIKSLQENAHSQVIPMISPTRQQSPPESRRSRQSSKRSRSPPHGDNSYNPVSSSDQAEATKSHKQKKESKKQVQFQLVINKHKKQELGIIVSDEMYKSTETAGFLITGIAVGSEAYTHFQNDKLRLLDIITKANNQPFIPGGPGQEMFDNIVHPCALVTLDINRSVALPPVSEQLSKATKKFKDISHVLAMRRPSVHGQMEFGLSLQNKLTEVLITGCAENSPACLAGLKPGADNILVCMLSSKEEIDKEYITAVSKSEKKSIDFKTTVEKTLKKADEKKKVTILFVRRNSITRL